MADSGLESPVELAIRFGLSKPGVSTVLVGDVDVVARVLELSTS